jgi:hypothetical protein
VTAAATDKLSFDIRATAPNSAGAILQVTDASGAVVCGQFEVICRATGSTSYQLLVTAEGYQGIAITSHVDAWLVGTASGWAPQCRAHQLSGATGWAPIRVKMSEAAVGYCAVLSVQANQETTIYSPSSTDTGIGQPSMMLDTRTGLGAPRAQLGAGKTLQHAVDGAGGVPGTGVSAVDLSVIVQNPSHTGALTAFADGTARPAASQLAFVAGQTTAGLISVPVTDGTVDLYNGSSGPVDLTADVTGYFSGSGARFQAAGPARALDTRTGLGGAGVSVLAHSAADPSLGALPGWEGTQQQVVLSVTVLDASASGFLSVFPDGSAVPADPNLIFHAGKPVTVQMIIPMTGPTIDFYNNSDGTIQVLADVQGYGVPG